MLGFCISGSGCGYEVSSSPTSHVPLCTWKQVCSEQTHCFSPLLGSCKTLLHAVSTGFGLRWCVGYGSQVLYVAEVSRAPACCKGFPRPGRAASVFPLLLSYPECELSEIQQFLYWAFHLFPVVRLLEMMLQGSSLCLSLKWPQRETDKDRRDAQNPAGLKYIQGAWPWASLVAQWLRICLPMQGTRVRALVWEGPTCRGATGPMSHNY